jgi:lipopolysaccharide biosynthesis protein
MEEQAALAREYGISGFAYYFYWFAGKVLMDDPLKQMLANPKIDMPFCMIWANENWTRRWDGKEHDVLIAQKHSIEDSRALLDYLRPFFDDPRYIRINGKPLFVIYRADIIPDLKKTLEVWRAQAESFGLPGLYIVCAQTFGQRDPNKFGFDAAMQFPPHTVQSNSIVGEIEGLEAGFSGFVYDYDQAVTNAVQHRHEEYKVFPTAMLSWDNTARKNINAHIFARFSVSLYTQWLSSNVEFVAKDSKLSCDEKIVFVNAWNEWAEGTHLEPDQKHGYGYLAATRSVMGNYVAAGARFLDPAYPDTARARNAVVVHVHYEHTWPDLRDAICRLIGRDSDLYVTATSLALAEVVSRDFPEATVELVDNRGRDIRPFLRVLKKIKGLGYTAVCKVHGKASAYRIDGDELRRSAFSALVDGANIDCFAENPRLGMLVPPESLVEHSEKNLTYSGVLTQALAQELGLSQWRGVFPAGSMFWFRPDALAPLTKLGVDDFDIERGLADGTRAHAIERLFCAVCKSTGYSVDTTRVS